MRQTRGQIRAAGSSARNVAALAGLTLIMLSTGGCNTLITDLMVAAPNQALAQAGVGESVGPHDRRFLVEVGPPAAALSVRVIDPPAQGGGASEPRHTLFFIHGYRSEMRQVTTKALAATEAGYRAVLVDLRGHGGSTGRYITYGARESRDLAQVLDALERRGLVAGDVGAWGVSMGAATVIQWAARDERVRAVVAVAPYASMRQVMPPIVRAGAPVRGWRMSDAEIQEIVDEAAAEAGFDPDEADTLRAIRQTEAPVLIIGGRIDAVTPIAHSRMLHEAAPDHSELVELELTGHVGALLDVFSEIDRLSLAWFERRLGR